MIEKVFAIYILTNQRKTVFYTGVTSALKRRIYEHKNKLIEGFTKKYNVDCLVYYETTTDSLAAIAREKQIKDYRRSKKIALINGMNPGWKDLYDGI